MDQFYWKFDSEAKRLGHVVHWFFPNKSNHPSYNNLIVHSKHDNPEITFLDYCKKSEIKFDYVYTHFVECCSKFSKEVKNIFPQCHLISVDHNPRPIGGYPFVKKIKKKLKGKIYSRYTDLFIGVSSYTVNELVNDFGNQIKPKSKVIYNGIEADHILINRNRCTTSPRFMVSSHLRPSKGIMDLIIAVHMIASEKRNGLTIDIYGDGPQRAELESRIDELSLGDIFTFKGNSPNLSEIYKLYDYLIHPSYMECLSLSILESLAANVPVITTYVGGSPEVVKDKVNGYLFNAGDINKLSNIIEGVYNGNMSIQASTDEIIRSNFHLNRMVKEYIDLLG